MSHVSEFVHRVVYPRPLLDAVEAERGGHRIPDEALAVQRVVVGEAVQELDALLGEVIVGRGPSQGRGAEKQP